MKTRRLMTGVALLSSAALVLAACGGDADDTGATDAGAGAEESMEGGAADFAEGTTMAELAEAGTIRIGTKFDQPGFGLANLDGVPEGFDVEIANIIADELGIPEDGREYVETPSAIREEVLINDEVDLVAATYTINDERAERIDFAGPYYVAGQALMVREEDAETITAPEDLSDTAIRVCSVDGSTPSENIREYLGSEDQLTLFADYSACADSLGNNQVDVVTTDNVILLGLVDASEGAFTLVGEAFTEEPYGIGVQNEDVEFCQFINDTLEAANEDGRYLEAWDSTAGGIAGAEAPEFPELTPCE
ncbi:transporter substrate-binding domain-containing protein [Jannaschia sp. R86511]|uniref:glutamate ABC transporter substrate-binding protein n=1 Tax=Jannaschia sp. R86511 TaxID=3093853 RepID=UPI0036D4352A